VDGLAGIPIDRSRLMLAVIILAAFAFRSYQLPSTPPGLFFDEALEGNQALESISLTFAANAVFTSIFDRRAD
jgi:hypothetical protein